MFTYFTYSCLALISASEDTQCVLVVCDFPKEWLSFLHSAFFVVVALFVLNIGTEVVYIQLLLVVTWLVPRVKLLPSRRTFCVHHTTMHRFTVSFYVTSIPLISGNPKMFSCIHQSDCYTCSNASSNGLPHCRSHTCVSQPQIGQ